MMTLVVRVCSPLIVATAKGSGKPASRGERYVRWGTAQVRTEDITLVEAVGGDDCGLSALFRGAEGSHALVMRRLGWPAPSMVTMRRQTAGALRRGSSGGRRCWETRRRGATGRLSELAGVRVCSQRRRRWPRGAAENCVLLAAGCWLLGCWRGLLRRAWLSTMSRG